MINLKRQAYLRQEGARIANILIALHKMFPHMRGLMRWYQYYRQLEVMRREAEEKRIAEIAETETQELSYKPVQHISAKALLFGEQAERDTDEIALMEQETEQRPVVKPLRSPTAVENAGEVS